MRMNHETRPRWVRIAEDAGEDPEEINQFLTETFAEKAVDDLVDLYGEAKAALFLSNVLEKRRAQ